MIDRQQQRCVELLLSEDLAFPIVNKINTIGLVSGYGFHGITRPFNRL